MKILLLSKPRSASSSFFFNLLNYYASNVQFQNLVTYALIPRPDKTDTVQSAKQSLDSVKVSLDAMKGKEIKLVKIYPYTSFDASQFEDFCNLFDTVYQITGKDEFDRSLSAYLSDKYKVYGVGSNLTNHKDALLANRLTVDINDFITYATTYPSFLEVQSTRITNINYNDYTKVKDRDSFTTILKLDPSESFKFNNDTLEWGDKAALISNLDALKLAYSRSFVKSVPNHHL